VSGNQVRGIRGAVSVSKNDASEIIEATKCLLKQIVMENELNETDMVSIIFTVTSDLNVTFPAVAARELGWVLVPLLCAAEIEVPDSLPGIIRVLMHVNTAKKQQEIKHVYLGEARRLRPDLS
jgi:chorismate mutase